MSEIGLNINVDSYNNEGIKTIKGNNNAEIYKLYILKNKRRLSLVGKTVKLGYVMAGTTKGDIIENLNITNAEQGEITFPITNRISKQDGVYSCQLAIYGADEFLEYTATFGLTVEDNIFTKIAGEIENSKDLTYIERILEEAKTVSGDLKTNIPVATNLNSSLESNISNARNINTTLSDTTEKSKVVATDAIEKKSQLESSIVKAKEFINGLDGSQNIPQLRLDVTELQNGLKSNQALEYSGNFITANNTLEGRTEGMVLRGKTSVKDGELESFGEIEKVGDKYKIGLLSYGKNLMNVDDFYNTLKAINNEGIFKEIKDNKECIKLTQNFEFSSRGYENIKFKKNTQYTFTGNAYHTSDNKAILTIKYIEGGYTDVEITPNEWTEFNVTTEKNKTIKGIYSTYTTNTFVYIDKNTFMIEEGNKTSHFEFYKSCKKDILIKEPLREWDILFEDNGEIKTYRKTKEFKGDITSVYGIAKREKTTRFNISYTDDGLDNNPNFICNLQKTNPNCYGEDVEGCFGTSVGAVLSFSNDKIREIGITEEEIKKWLKNNNFTCVYKLAKQKIEIVENCVDIDLDTYQDKTYFNILNSLPGTLDFKVPSNIASIVQNTAREVNNIWDVINNLLVPSIVKANGNLAMLKLNNNLK